MTVTSRIEKEAQDTIQVLMEPGFDLPFGACFQVLAQTLDNGESSVLQMNYRNMGSSNIAVQVGLPV